MHLDLYLSIVRSSQSVSQSVSLVTQHRAALKPRIHSAESVVESLDVVPMAIG